MPSTERENLTQNTRPQKSTKLSCYSASAEVLYLLISCSTFILYVLLSKIFNINTLKLSYSFMPNMAAVISQHNSSILRGGKTIDENYAGGRPCNCRIKVDCPLNGTCQVRSVVYKATITTTSERRGITLV